MNESIDRERSLEELEDCRWPDPPDEATHMVKSVYALRRIPVQDLRVDELRRLIGQNIGLRWILPIALEILDEQITGEVPEGWIDDDLFSAVLTREASLWAAHPDMALAVKEMLSRLKDISEYIAADADRFHAAVPAGL